LCRVRRWRERRHLLREGSGLGGLLTGCGFRRGSRCGNRLCSRRWLAGFFRFVLRRYRRIWIWIRFQWWVVRRRRTNRGRWLCRVPRRQFRRRVFLLGFPARRLGRSNRCRGQSQAQHDRHYPSLK
jgi:hypothetical protein